MPLLHLLLRVGFASTNICVLIATGTHRPMESSEIEAMLGPEPAAMGVNILNHNSTDDNQLIYLGNTARGSTIKINKAYMQADLKILTGLVESHFMAGASGGRKSICPGILGRQGTLVFHSAAMMCHPKARDLVLDGNPVHEEALEAARMAGADFIVNVTLNNSFQITGIFCGELAAAHAAAVVQLRSQISIPVAAPYNLVVTHGGFVALNHYQAAKCGIAALEALKQGGQLIIVANNTDIEPVGSAAYRTALALLKQAGAEAFFKLLANPDWPFLFDQWQVQKWAEILRHLSKNGLTYYAPQLSPRDWDGIPGENGAALVPTGAASPQQDIPIIIKKSVKNHMDAAGYTKADVLAGRYRIAFLADGPYGIPVQK